MYQDLTKEELIAKLVENEERMKNQMVMEHKRKADCYRDLNRFAKKGQILFTGSSLMEMFPVNEYEMSRGKGRIVYNRGIGGTTTDDFLREIDAVLFDLEPSKVFINIGTNDIREREDGEYWQDHLLKNYEEILKQIKERLPETTVYLMAYYPVVDELMRNNPWAKTRTNAVINDTNEKVKLLAEKYDYQYIDVNDGIKEADGNLRRDITIEGLHMYPRGYESIFDNLQKYMD